jgi:hypothetical protein
LTLAIGVRYLLSFDVVAKAAGQTGTRTTFVGIDGQTFFAMANNILGGTTATATRTVAFTATATNQVLYFSASGDGGGNANCMFSV